MINWSCAVMCCAVRLFRNFASSMLSITSVKSSGVFVAPPSEPPVVEEEPLPAASPLRAMESVILGSHNASNTRQAVERTSRLAVDNLLAHLDTPRPAAPHGRDPGTHP